ncbi:MAG: peptidylprolyl isomerase [Verrucomicrobiota bacterium]
MKTKMKMIFPVTLAALVFGVSSAPAAAGTASTNAAPAALGTNANPEAAMTALFGDPVIIKGKGLELKRSQLDSVTSSLKAMFAARGLAAPPNVEGQALLVLIHQQLILSKATETDKAKGKEKFNASLQKLKTSQHLTDEEFNQTLNKQLILSGQTRSQWDQQNIEQATIPFVFERELNINVTDAEAKEFYTNHPADFEQPEKVRLCDIMLLAVNPNTGTPLPTDQLQAKRQKMDDLLKRARSGENFTNLAAQYSEDPATKDNNGVLPPVSRDQMRPELAAAAFSLTNNQVSDVVEMAYGNYIIKLLDKIPAKKLDYATVADDVKDFLKQQKITRLAPPYLEKLKQASGVEILDAKLKAMEMAVEAALSNSPPMTPEK